MAAMPLALITAPSPLTMPLDVVLGLALPLHAHIGMNYVITDYVPKLSRKAVGPARVFMVGVTGATVLGLMKVNFMGDGITTTVKGLWTGTGEKK